MFAIALYNNQAETEDELDFNKDDLFEVVEVDYMGLEGWWLCKLLSNSKVGLAAGNRLKAIDRPEFERYQQQQQLKQNTNKDKINVQQKQSSNNEIKFNKSEINHETPTNTIINNNNNNNNKNMNFITKSFENLLNDCNQTNKTNNTKSHQQRQHQDDNEYEFDYDIPENNQPLLSNVSKNNSNNNESRNNKIKSSKKHDDDDYEYDIPENNRPLGLTTNTSTLTKQQQQRTHVISSYSDNEILNNPTSTSSIKFQNAIKHTSTVSSSSSGSPSTQPIITCPRKSNSPTIDSGISSSSLMSLNDNLSNVTASSSSSYLSIKDEYLIESEKRLNKIINNVRDSCKILNEIQEKSGWRRVNNLEKNITQIKVSFYEIKALLHEFLEIIIQIKSKYASKYLKSDSYIKYKELYLKLHDFIEDFDANLLKIDSLNWSCKLLSSNNVTINDELQLNLQRLSYLLELIQLIHEYNYQTGLFINQNEHEYQLPKIESQMSSHPHAAAASLSSKQMCKASNDFDDEADIYENDDEEWLEQHQQQMSQPVKTPATGSKSLSNSDKMLIRFYYNHIEDNFSEIKSYHDLLVKYLNNYKQQNEDDQMGTIDLANKLALTGHKLVFICDTLNRNINNQILKTMLLEQSTNLSEYLKLYVIRIKTYYNIGNRTTSSSPLKLDEKQIKTKNLAINDSLTQVFNCSCELKKLLLPYIG